MTSRIIYCSGRQKTLYKGWALKLCILGEPKWWYYKSIMLCLDKKSLSSDSRLICKVRQLDQTRWFLGLSKLQSFVTAESLTVP